VTKLKTYESFQNSGVSHYLKEEGGDITEERFQQMLAFKPEKAWVDIQSIFRVQDLDRNEFLTWSFLVHALDYFDAEHKYDDSDGCYTEPVAVPVKDTMGNPMPSRLESSTNAHILEFSPENVDKLFTDFTYFLVDKEDHNDNYFKRKRLPLKLEVRRKHLTKFYIAKTSIAPDHIAERPIRWVPNIDDFKYLSWDRLYELSTDTRVSKQGELKLTPHNDTMKILKSKTTS